MLLESEASSHFTTALRRRGEMIKSALPELGDSLNELC